MTEPTRPAVGRTSELRLPQAWRRATGVVTAAGFMGLAMTSIVFANYGNLRAAGLTLGAFALSLYLLGTAAYRVTIRGRGQVESHTVLGLTRFDLTKGFSVRQARYGRALVVVRVGRRRIRLNGGLGRADAVDRWLRAVANADA